MSSKFKLEEVENLKQKFASRLKQREEMIESSFMFYSSAKKVFFCEISNCVSRF